MKLITILLVALTCLSMLISIGNAQTGFGMGFPDSDGGAEQQGGDGADGDVAVAEPGADGGLGAKSQDADAELNPEQQGCFQSFYDNNMGPCLQELTKGHETKNVTIDNECCTYLTSIDSSCVSVVHFQDPQYQTKVEQHCTTASAPSASSPVGLPGRKSMPSFPDPAFGPATAKASSAESPSGPKLGSAAETEDPEAESTPVTESSDPEEDQPVAEDAAPGTEEEAPVTEEDKPVAEDAAPGTEEEAPATEEDKPAEGK